MSPIGRTSVALMGLLLAAQSPAPATSPQAPPAEETAIDQLVFDSDRHRRITVPVTISGRGPYRFFIDTGSQATVVGQKIAADLQLQPSGRARLVAMGSVQEVDTVELDELQFANRTFNGLTSPLLRDRNLGADGILGLDSLQDLRVLIDFQAGTIEVADASLLGGNSGYEIVVRARRHLGQMIITNARINGVRTAVIIDTGAQNSLGNPALRKKLRGRDEDGALVSTDVLGVAMESELYLADKLSIGGLELRDVPMGFSASPAFTSLGLDDRPALILGMNNLQVFERVAIDFAAQRVLFDTPGSTYAQDLRRRVFFPTRLGTI